MPEIILYRAKGERGDEAEQKLKEHNIDYVVSMRTDPGFTMPRLETPYGTYEGEDGIEQFLRERISQRHKKK